MHRLRARYCTVTATAHQLYQRLEAPRLLITVQLGALGDGGRQARSRSPAHAQLQAIGR